MHLIEAAIMRTILYGDIFDCALTAEEIHHFLIHDEGVSFAIVCEVLTGSPLLHTRLINQNGYFALKERPELILLRQQRREIAESMWTQALECGVWLSRLPFVRMVALTGALAAQNPSKKRDDYDYLVVTQSGRVWLTRAFAILLVRLGKLRGVVICPNYVLSEDALTQNRRDLFMAREVAQMIPLYGMDIYGAMRETNSWTEEYLPNALTAFHPFKEQTSQRRWTMLKQGMEWLLSGKLGDILEQWEYRRKLQRFSADLKTPHSAAQLDSNHVKGHFNDHGHPVLISYEARLQRYHCKDVLTSD
jgi:hypothetical protein